MRVILIILATFSFASCSSSNSERVRGAILPHHNLVAEYIDQAYSEDFPKDIERIILISPNHENLGKQFVQTTDSMNAEIKLDIDFIDKLVASRVAGIEPINFESEHGIMVHIDRIARFYPEAKVVPIILKWRVPEENLDNLIEAISKENLTEKTLIIASIDFSHYVTEKTAWENDQRTIEWLEKWSQGNRKFNLEEIRNLEKTSQMDTDQSTAMDSPESFYVFTKLMESANSLTVWKRTSSAANFGVTTPMQNTSHIFAEAF